MQHHGLMHAFDPRQQIRRRERIPQLHYNRKCPFLEYIPKPYYISTFWQMLYNDIIMTYPMIPTDDEKERMKLFISKLTLIIPCYSNSCKVYIKKYINFLKIDDITRDRNTLYDFFYKFRTDLLELFGKEIADSDKYHYYDGVF